MGGGDLNSKKSWHPNTIKNQERVWKAEQAVAEEKKRMLELQRERDEERDRSELNEIMNKKNSASSSDHRLSWMYEKPDKKVEQEEYLLGKALNKSLDQQQNAVQDPIPAVSRRVVGSSMLTAGGDTQVDMSRKIREDPLILIKERERAARAALLNNPLQRRKLTELLRKEQNKRNESKAKEKSKKKHKDLDDLLTAKLNALGGQKGIDLATLLNSDDTSSDSEVEKSKKKNLNKHKKKKKKKRQHSDDESEKSLCSKRHHEDGKSSNACKKSRSEYQYDKCSDKDSRQRGSTHYREGSVESREYRKRTNDERQNSYESSRKPKINNNERYRQSALEDNGRKRDADHRHNKRKGGLSEAEKAARLAEMAAAGAEREVERGKRVAEQRIADESAVVWRRAGGSQHEARVLPESLESRIRSNRHYIQRDKQHMNENFARR